MGSLILTILILLFSCKISIRGVNRDEFYNGEAETPEGYILAPKSVRDDAYRAAQFYITQDTEYTLGGQDYIEPPRSIKVDCSGLIVNNYKFAVKISGHSLPFEDSTADDLFKKYSVEITHPERGDLIFWINQEGRAYHVAMFEKEAGNYFYFIDSTELEGVSGVSRRFIHKSNVQGLGRIKLLTSKVE